MLLEQKILLMIGLILLPVQYLVSVVLPVLVSLETVHLSRAIVIACREHVRARHKLQEPRSRKTTTQNSLALAANWQQFPALVQMYSLLLQYWCIYMLVEGILPSLFPWRQLPFANLTATLAYSVVSRELLAALAEFMESQGWLTAVFNRLGGGFAQGSNSVPSWSWWDLLHATIAESAPPAYDKFLFGKLTVFWIQFESKISLPHTDYLWCTSQWLHSQLFSKWNKYFYGAEAESTASIPSSKKQDRSKSEDPNIGSQTGFEKEYVHDLD